MNQGLLIRIVICVFAVGGFLYTYIDRQNDLTELKIAIPQLKKTLHVLEEENRQLSLEIHRFEDPSRLIGFLRDQEYSHLHYPNLDEVVICHADD